MYAFQSARLNSRDDVGESGTTSSFGTSLSRAIPSEGTIDVAGESLRISQSWKSSVAVQEVCTPAD